LATSYAPILLISSPRRRRCGEREKEKGEEKGEEPTRTVEDNREVRRDGFSNYDAVVRTPSA